MMDALIDICIIVMICCVAMIAMLGTMYFLVWWSERKWKGPRT